MKGALLLEGRSDEIKAYMLEKFKLWGSWRYSKATRIKKSLAYYEYADTTGKEAIKSAYEFSFKEKWPAEAQQKYELMLKSREKTPKLERGEAMRLKEKKLAKLEQALETLNQWKKSGKSQEGSDFYVELKSLVEPLIDGTFDRTTFTQENSLRGVKSLTSSTSIDKKGVEANFEYMAGIHAQTKTEFIFDSDLLKGATTLEGEMKVGTWGNGSVQTKIGKGGLDASAAIALAFGMDCRVEGNTTWKINDFGVALQGKAHLFVGAQVKGSAGLKINTKGIEAQIQAGAFAGVKAKCSGKMAFQYMDEDMLAVAAEAWFSFGAGASFEASIKSSLFGPTEFKFSADLAIGMGAGVSTSTSVNFDRMKLAANANFQKLVYLPTIMKGYSGELMNQDRINAHYLAKATGRLEDEIASLNDKLSSASKVPSEKQSLLMSMDD